MAEEHKPSGSAWIERNLQNLIMAAFGMIMAWMASTVQSLTVTTAEMNTKIGFLTENMKEANVNTVEIANIKARVAVLEARIRDDRATSTHH